MQPDYSNHTLYSLKSPTGRYLWFTYQLLIVLLSLVGDTIILVGSRRYNAFNLHRLLVGIIEHLAVADIVYSAILVAQGAVTVAADRWVLGDFLCHFQVYVGYWDYCCIMWFTAALIVSKNLIIKFPFRSHSWSKHRAHGICLLIWVGCLAIPISIGVLMGLDHLHIEKDYVVYKCGTNSQDHMLWLTLVMTSVNAFIFLVLPNILVVSGTICLIYQAVKLTRRSTHRETVKWQGIRKVIATASLYCFSNLPLVVYFILRGFISDENTVFHVTYNRTALNISYLNLASNFFVNFATVPSFRSFVLRVPVPAPESRTSRSSNTETRISRLSRTSLLGSAVRRSTRSEDITQSILVPETRISLSLRPTP